MTTIPRKAPKAGGEPIRSKRGNLVGYAVGMHVSMYQQKNRGQGFDCTTDKD